MASILLREKFVFWVAPKPPFSFKGTVYNPSHFPAPTELYETGKFWQTLRFGGKVLGMMMEDKGTPRHPKLYILFFSPRPLLKSFQEKLKEEIKYRFQLDWDPAEFNGSFSKDRLLGPVLKRWRGMRSKCGYSLYESLMIYLVLQNATVRRTVKMLENLLGKFGQPVEFDGKKLYAFWEPEALAGVSEEELRQLKVGYRAKFFKKLSQKFAAEGLAEKELRQLSQKDLLKKVKELPGVGPASASYLLFEVFHDYETFTVLPPWEQRIYSRLLYNKEGVPAEKILAEMDKRWGKWKRLAAHYLFTDLFWQRENKKIPWLEKLIKL